MSSLAYSLQTGPMIHERLFYFIHGLCTMFFIMVSIGLWKTENKTRLQQVLMGVMCYWALLELKDLLFYNSYMVRKAFLPDLLIIIDSSAVAAGLSYLLELLSPRWLSWRRALLLFSPFILMTLLFVVSSGAAWVMSLHLIVTGLLGAIFLSYIAWGVRRYNRYINNNYSNIERINIKWLSTATILLAICFGFWVTSCLFTSWTADTLFQFSLILLWAPIIYFTSRQQEVLIPERDEEEELLNEDQPLDELDIQLQHIRRGLKQQLIEERLYLNPHLTLVDLSTAIGTNRTYLSNYLNQQLHTTFYDYINSLRLKRAKEFLSDPACNITLVEIAEQSGFNSQSTFRRTFQRTHGCSPIEWRLQRLKGL